MKLIMFLISIAIWFPGTSQAQWGEIKKEQIEDVYLRNDGADVMSGSGAGIEVDDTNPTTTGHDLLSLKKNGASVFKVNEAGSTTVFDNLAVYGDIFNTGVIQTNSNISLDDNNSAGAASVYFSGFAEELNWNGTYFILSDDLAVLGYLDVLSYIEGDYYKVSKTSSGWILTVENTSNMGIYYNATTNVLSYGDNADSNRVGVDLDNGNTTIDGTLEVGGDVTFDGEIKGTAHTIQFSRAAAFTVPVAPTIALLKWGEVQLDGSKGFIARKAGSLIGLTVQYDITTLGSGTMRMSARINGNNKLFADHEGPGGDNRYLIASSSRGTFTFAAGDYIYFSCRALSGSTYTINDVIAAVDIIYDE